MLSLIELIRIIVKHPEIYLGKPSVQRLYAYIGGFLHQNEEANDHCLDGFNEYIASYYRITSDHNWADIIEFFSNCDQEEISLFRKHFDDFMNSKNLTGQGDGLREP